MVVPHVQGVTPNFIALADVPEPSLPRPSLPSGTDSECVCESRNQNNNNVYYFESRTVQGLATMF